MIDIDSFLNTPGTFIDVRSPAEFQQGHIPGAINIPILNNEERAAVGTSYKKLGQSAAVELGFSLAGPNFAGFIAKARTLEGPLKVYCWRGGLRSSSMAWIFKTAGMNAIVLKNGYKGFRQWALSKFKQQKQIYLLGGLTGSGKTEHLHRLATQGEQVLDLEGLANHKGSSFGMIGMPAQPTNEQFENEISLRWNQFNECKPVWIEDESRMIGYCKIPDSIYSQMQHAKFHWLDSPREERLTRLLKDYGNAPAEELIAATMRLTKKLGSERTKDTIRLMREGNLKSAFDLLLDYYDSAYMRSLKKWDAPLKERHPIISLNQNS